MTPNNHPELDEYQVRQASEEQVAVALARLGWIMPLWIRSDEAAHLLGGGDPNEVDAAFVQYYTGDGAARYERLIGGLRGAANHRWENLIIQMDAAYRREEYAIVVPAALVVLEGVLTRGQDIDQSVRDLVRGRVPEPPDGYSLHRVMWLAANELVSGLYSRQDFNGAAPQVLNRHWILHGRAASDWSHADCLRLLHACNVASYLATNAV